MQIEYYKSWKFGNMYTGFDLDFRDWGLGIVYSFYSGRPYFSIQVGPLSLFIGEDH